MDNGRKRGFAAMDPERQKEIASKGGRAAHAKGTAHEWSRDQARIAGKKGGVVVSKDRAHMSAIGREGGEARGRVTALSRPEVEHRSRSSRRFVERAAKVSLVREESADSTLGLHLDEGDRRDERRVERA
jgi:general stress protein YciG